MSMSFLAIVEAAAVAAGVGAVSEITTTFYDGFMDKISASNSLEQIHGTLNDLLERLLAKRDDCQDRLQRHKNKMPTNTYNNWVCRVMEIEKDVKDFETKFEKENNSSRLWHFLRRSEFYQEMKDTCEIVLKLLEESNQLGEYLVDQPPKPVEVMGEPPDKKYWLEKNWISLIDNELQTLPDRPDCSVLSTLFLQKNLSLKTIPALFFEYMETLTVLDLSCTGIMSLPQSISKLISLEVFYLKDCIYLTELPSQLEELQHLEVFDFRGSGVKSIPSFIEKLMCLRRLLVSFADNKFSSVASNCNVISKLFALKELIIDVKAPRKQWSVKMLNATIEKIVPVKLTTLQFRFLDETVDIIKLEASTTYICVPNADILRIFMKRDDLCFASFQVCIGCYSTCPRIPMPYQYERYMKCESFNPTVSELLAKADAFELVNLPAENLMEFFKSMDQVRGLLIESCNAIGTIVDGNSTINSPILPNLERLYIKNMPKLKSILEGYLPFGSLCKIKTLVVSDCPMLINIFSQGLVQQLSGIQQLEVEDCFEIEEIIMEFENTGMDPFVLPNLEKMTLHNMPKLRSIWANESLAWHSLKELEIHDCPNLSRLPFNKENALNLRSIKSEQDWWNALQWQRNEDKEHFRQYCNFRIMSTTANTVEGTNRIVQEAPRDVSQETPSGAAASKRRLLAADKGKPFASSGNGKRFRVDQTSGISIHEPGTSKTNTTMDLSV